MKIDLLSIIPRQLLDQPDEVNFFLLAINIVFGLCLQHSDLIFIILFYAHTTQLYIGRGSGHKWLKSSSSFSGSSGKAIKIENWIKIAKQKESHYLIKIQIDFNFFKVMMFWNRKSCTI